MGNELGTTKRLQNTYRIRRLKKKKKNEMAKQNNYYWKLCVTKIKKYFIIVLLHQMKRITIVVKRNLNDKTNKQLDLRV